jgi:Uma2 family endonuclease
VVTAFNPASAFPVIELKDYFWFEERSESKNEYFYGHVYGMAGGSSAHSALSGAAYVELVQALAGKKCQVRNSDFRIETPQSNAVFYPDVSVHCNQVLEPNALTGKAPTLLVEVLSPSTRRYDLTTKRKEYFLIPSLRHYLLLDSEKVEATLYSRGEAALWAEEPQRVSSLEESIPLEALGIVLSMQALYRDSGIGD